MDIMHLLFTIIQLWFKVMVLFFQVFYLLLDGSLHLSELTFSNSGLLFILQDELLVFEVLSFEITQMPCIFLVCFQLWLQRRHLFSHNLIPSLFSFKQLIQGFWRNVTCRLWHCNLLWLMIYFILIRCSLEGVVDLILNWVWCYSKPFKWLYFILEETQAKVSKCWVLRFVLLLVTVVVVLWSWLLYSVVAVHSSWVESRWLTVDTIIPGSWRCGKPVFSFTHVIHCVLRRIIRI